MVFADGVPDGTDYSQLNQGNMVVSYRTRNFRAYLPRNEQDRRLKVGGLDSFENATGIYFDEGETADITVSGLGKRKLELIIYNSFRHMRYPLHEGKNAIKVKNPGLAYIDYRSMNPQEEPTIQVKINGGKINGVMTRHDDNNTWKRLLANAKCDVMDMIGERAHLLFWVDGLRKGCPENGVELINIYDRIVGFIEEDLLGFSRYKVHTGGHVLAHVLNSGYMSAGGDGVNLAISTFPGVASVKGLSMGAWGIAHEMGHIFQTRPGMKWGGMTEVTNNLAASYTNYMLNPGNTRLEHSEHPNVRGEKMHGGMYDCFVNNAIVQRQIWQAYSGPLPSGLPDPWEECPRSCFLGVIPFWQLLLYNMEARNQKDFYPQIYQNVRETDEKGLTNGELRVLFFKRACDAAKLDFSEYFIKTGMLVPMDREVSDYSPSHVTITREMCKEAAKYATRYPKPKSSVIYYISGDNVHCFKKKLAITDGKGPAPAIENERMEIPANRWKNAVAFEAYGKGKLLHVSLFSLNHKKKDGTTVICPKGTDAVMAVQWDGVRVPVLGAKSNIPRDNEPLASWYEPRGLGINSTHEAALHNSMPALLARLTTPKAIYDQYGSMKKPGASSKKEFVNVSERNEQGETALHIAARAGHTEIAQKLLEAGVDVMVKNRKGQLASDLTKDEKILSLIDKKMEQRKYELEVFAAIRAGKREVVAEALKKGINVNAYSANSNSTLLTEAITFGRPRMVAMLLAAKANPNVILPNGNTPLTLAASKGNAEIIDTLLKNGADPMLTQRNGAYALHNAIWSQKPEAVKRLLPAYKHINFSPFTNNLGYPIMMAINRNLLGIVQMFLDAGMDVNDKRFSSEPLLIVAAKRNSDTLVRMLLKANADKNIKDKKGKRAIDYAKGETADLLR